MRPFDFAIKGTREGAFVRSHVKKTRLLLIVVVIVIILPGFALGSWMVTEIVIDNTSGRAFCASCHTMEPFESAYLQDVHGGAGDYGVVAKCTDCHLPHDNVANYMLKKTQFGLHDAWAQLTYDLEAIDWQAKRAHRERFVFDSGCLQCHADLQRASLAQTTAFVAHRPYFRGETTRQCVSCHAHVGHKDLTAVLSRSRN